MLLARRRRKTVDTEKRAHGAKLRNCTMLSFERTTGPNGVEESGVISQFLEMAELGRGGNCTYCKNRIGLDPCINNIVKLKVIIAAFVVLTGEEPLKKAMRIFFFFYEMGRLGTKAMALCKNC